MMTQDDIAAVIELGAGRLGLSPQQVRIVVLLAEGNHSKEIGHELGLTWRTVDAYMQRIFTKLGIDNRITLIVSCVVAGMNDGKD
jgi:DNA-binding NarL/FixJ family response regulator